LLIVKKFRNDSFIIFESLKKVRAAAKKAPPSLKRVKGFSDVIQLYLIYNTYSDNEHIQKIPKVCEIFHETQRKQFDKELQRENDGEEIVTVEQEDLHIFLLW